ncbi:transporter substrate-binding domain-containing protein [Maricurvus nonylphenolicus]|uniref:substrate-binding periplasmic protein n=1 Tax=Maricurvus nonylphenolicus TaxID=1008307 RepID=UPI0036F1FB91
MKMVRDSLILSLCILLGLGARVAIAAEVQVGFGQQKPPFVFIEEKRGLELDLVREALAYRGHTMQATLLPKRRLQRMLHAKKLDGMASLRISESSPGVYFSAPYITFNNFAISKLSANHVINSFEDLRGKRVLAWPNARKDLGADFARVVVPPVGMRGLYSEHEQTEQNRFFWRYPNAVILIDKSIFGWFRQQLSISLDTSEEVVLHPIFEGGSRYGVAFHNEVIRNDFDAGLAQLHSTGRYQALVESYIK